MLDEMNLSNPNPRFSVYVHTSPHGKRYVGITTQRPATRWGCNGNGYRDNKHFYAAIKRYGWDNFEHTTVATDLDLYAASELESTLIAQYETMNPAHGYNQTTGGNWSSPSAEVREKLRQRTAERWSNPEYHAKMCAIQQSLAAKHKKPISEEERSRKLLAHRRISWNKGKTKDNDTRVWKISQTLKGRTFSADTLNKMRASRKQLYADGYKPIWINNGQVEQQLTSDLSNIPDGFKIGRLPTVYLTNGIVTRKVNPCEADELLQQGWRRGKSNKIEETIRNCRRQFIWKYDNHEFYSAAELATYLRTHGYPNIVGSTITMLYNKGFESSKIYCSLAGKITRERISHENN